MATLCFCPPESWGDRHPSCPAGPPAQGVKVSFCPFPPFERPLCLRAKPMLLYTVLEGIRLKCWKIMPIFLRNSLSSFSGSFVRSVPSMRTSPLSGRSSRFMHLTRVDFPAPENPMMPETSPSAMRADIPLRHARCCLMN